MRATSQLRALHEVSIGVMVVALLAFASTLISAGALPDLGWRLADRQAAVSRLLDGANRRIVQEGYLYYDLAVQTTPQGRAQVRSVLKDNEERFHDLAQQVAAQLPAVGGQLAEVVRAFDRLAATGQAIDALMSQQLSADAIALMQGRFAPDLIALRDDGAQLAESIHFSAKPWL